MQEVFIYFSLRRCDPYQVPRDSLNSFQNTPKALTNVQNILLKITNLTLSVPLKIHLLDQMEIS